MTKFWITFLLACVVLARVPAFADDRFNCANDDKDLRLSLDVGFSEEPGQGLIHLRGAATFTVNAPDEIRTIRLESNLLKQYWFDGKDLRLRFVQESYSDSPFYIVDFTVAVSKTLGQRMAGSYDVIIRKTTEKRMKRYSTIFERSDKLLCSKR
ncbi:hypothetical protein [Rhizobium sp. PAMB 3182]